MISDESSDDDGGVLPPSASDLELDEELLFSDTTEPQRSLAGRCCSTSGRGFWTLAGLWTTAAVLVLAVLGVSLTVASLLSLQNASAAGVTVHTVNASLNADNTATTTVEVTVPTISHWHAVSVRRVGCLLTLHERHGGDAPLYVGYGAVQDIGAVSAGGLFHAGPAHFRKSVSAALTQVQSDNLEAARQSILAGRDILHASCTVDVDVSVWGALALPELQLHWRGYVGRTVSSAVNPVINSSHASVHHSSHRQLPSWSELAHSSSVELPLAVGLSVKLPSSVTSFVVNLPPTAFNAVPAACHAPPAAGEPTWLLTSPPISFDLVQMAATHDKLQPNVTLSCSKQTSLLGDIDCHLNAVLHRIYAQTMQTDCSRIAITSLVGPNLLTWLVAPDHEVLLTKSATYNSHIEQLHLDVNVTLDQHWQVAASALVNGSRAAATLAYADLHKTDGRGHSFAEGAADWRLDSGLSLKALYNASVAGFDVVGRATLDVDTAARTLDFALEQQHDGNTLLTSWMTGQLTTTTTTTDDSQLMQASIEGATVWSGQHAFTVNYTGGTELLPRNGTYNVAIGGVWQSAGAAAVPVAAALFADFADAYRDGVVGALASFNGVDYFLLNVTWAAPDDRLIQSHSLLSVRVGDEQTVGAYADFVFDADTSSYDLAAGVLTTSDNDDTLLFSVGSHGQLTLPDYYTGAPLLVAGSASSYCRSLWNLTGELSLQQTPGVLALLATLSDGADTLLLVQLDGQLSARDGFLVASQLTVDWNALGSRTAVVVPFHFGFGDVYYSLSAGVELDGHSVLLVQSSGSVGQGADNSTSVLAAAVLLQYMNVSTVGDLSFTAGRQSSTVYFNDAGYSGYAYTEHGFIQLHASLDDGSASLFLLDVDGTSDYQSNQTQNLGDSVYVFNFDHAVAGTAQLTAGGQPLLAGSLDYASGFGETTGSQASLNYDGWRLDAALDTPWGQLAASNCSFALQAARTDENYFTRQSTLAVDAGWRSDELPWSLSLTSSTDLQSDYYNAVFDTRHATLATFDVPALAQLRASAVVDVHTSGNGTAAAVQAGLSVVGNGDAGNPLLTANVASSLAFGRGAGVQLDGELLLAYRSRVYDARLDFDLADVDTGVVNASVALVWSLPSSGGAVDGQLVVDLSSPSLSAGAWVYFPDVDTLLFAGELGADARSGNFFFDADVYSVDYSGHQIVFSVHGNGTAAVGGGANSSAPLLSVTGELQLQRTHNGSIDYTWDASGLIELSAADGLDTLVVAVSAPHVDASLTVWLGFQPAGSNRSDDGGVLLFDAQLAVDKRHYYDWFSLDVRPSLVVRLGSAPELTATCLVDVSGNYTNFVSMTQLRVAADLPSRTLAASGSFQLDNALVRLSAADTLLLQLLFGVVDTGDSAFSADTSAAIAVYSRHASFAYDVDMSVLVDFARRDVNVSLVVADGGGDAAALVDLLVTVGCSTANDTLTGVDVGFALSLYNLTDVSGLLVVDVQQRRGAATFAIDYDGASVVDFALHAGAAGDRDVSVDASLTVVDAVASVALLLRPSSGASVQLAYSGDSVLDFDAALAWRAGPSAGDVTLTGNASVNWRSAYDEGAINRTAELVLAVLPSQQQASLRLAVAGVFDLTASSQLQLASDGGQLTAQAELALPDAVPYAGALQCSVNNSLGAFALQLTAGTVDQLLLLLAVDSQSTFNDSDNTATVQTTVNLSYSGVFSSSTTLSVAVDARDSNFDVALTSLLVVGEGDERALKLTVSGAWGANATTDDDNAWSLQLNGATQWSGVGVADFATQSTLTLAVANVDQLASNAVSLGADVAWQSDEVPSTSWQVDTRYAWSCGGGSASSQLQFSVDGSQNGAGLLAVDAQASLVLVDGALTSQASVTVDDAVTVQLLLAADASHWQTSLLLNGGDAVQLTASSVAQWNVTLSPVSDTVTDVTFGTESTFNYALPRSNASGNWALVGQLSMEHTFSRWQAQLALTDDSAELLSGALQLRFPHNFRAMTGSASFSAAGAGSGAASAQYRFEQDGDYLLTCSLTALLSDSAQQPLFVLTGGVDAGVESATFWSVAADGSVELPAVDWSGGAEFDTLFSWDYDEDDLFVALPLTLSLTVDRRTLFSVDGQLELSAEGAGFVALGGAADIIIDGLRAYDASGGYTHAIYDEGRTATIAVVAALSSPSEPGAPLFDVDAKLDWNVDDDGAANVELAGGVQVWHGVAYSFVGFAGVPAQLNSYRAGFDVFAAGDCPVVLASSQGLWTLVDGYSVSTTSSFEYTPVDYESPCNVDRRRGFTADLALRSSLSLAQGVFSTSFNTRVDQSDVVAATVFGYFHDSYPTTTLAGAASLIYTGLHDEDAFTVSAGAELYLQDSTLTAYVAQRYSDRRHNNEEFLAQITGLLSRDADSAVSLTGSLLATLSGNDVDNDSITGNLAMQLHYDDGMSLDAGLSWNSQEFFASSTTTTWNLADRLFVASLTSLTTVQPPRCDRFDACSPLFVAQASGQATLDDGALSALFTVDTKLPDTTDTIVVQLSGDYSASSATVTIDGHATLTYQHTDQFDDRSGLTVGATGSASLGQGSLVANAAATYNSDVYPSAALAATWSADDGSLASHATATLAWSDVFSLAGTADLDLDLNAATQSLSAQAAGSYNGVDYVQLQANGDWTRADAQLVDFTGAGKLAWNGDRPLSLGVSAAGSLDGDTNSLSLAAAAALNGAPAIVNASVDLSGGADWQGPYTGALRALWNDKFSFAAGVSVGLADDQLSLMAGFDVNQQYNASATLNGHAAFNSGANIGGSASLSWQGPDDSFIVAGGASLHVNTTKQTFAASANGRLNGGSVGASASGSWATVKGFALSSSGQLDVDVGADPFTVTGSLSASYDSQQQTVTAHTQGNYNGAQYLLANGQAAYSGQTGVWLQGQGNLAWYGHTPFSTSALASLDVDTGNQSYNVQGQLVVDKQSLQFATSGSWISV